MKNLARKQRRPVEVAVAAAIAMSSFGSGAAFAQSTANQGSRQLEEIIVTTELRAQSEATTAVSMEVLTGLDLASNQIKDIIDLQNQVPALQFYQNGSYVQANIRGVGNPSTGGPSEQVGVPVFFDGATQGEEMALASGFFDVGDVQVLRGPQGTFVGQAAAGGAILINSARPNFDGLNGYIEAQAGTYNQRKIAGAINLPISDNLAARIAYMSDNRESFYTNAAGQHGTGGELYVPGDQEDDNFRVGLLWEPNESFSLYTKLEQTHLNTYGIPEQPNPNFYTGSYDDDGDPLTPPIAVSSYDRNAQGPAPGTGMMIDHDFNPATPDRLFGGVPGPGGVLYDPLDPRVLANPNAQIRIQKVDRVTVEANYTFDSGITFRSLSSDIKMDRRQVEGGNSLVFAPPTGFHLGPGMDTWSQEFNLISPEGQRLEWLVGAYKSNRHTELALNIDVTNRACGWEYDSTWRPCPTTGTRAIAPDGSPGNNLYWTSVDDVVHQAIFGQLNFDLSDSLEFVLEGRFNDDDNVQQRFNVFTGAMAATPSNPIVCPGQLGGVVLYCPDPTPNYATPQTFIWQGDLPTYKVGLNWEPVDDHFFYMFLARGYKAGQSTPSASSPIVEEIVDDFEIGWKGTLRPGLYAELGIYSMDYSDMQMAVFRREQDISQNGTRNIGDSTIQGIEGSLRAVFGGFGLNASFGYTDSELGEVTTIDTRALPFTGPGNIWPGDTNLGCVGALPTCFDYNPYLITLSGSQNLFSPKVSYTISMDYAFQLSNGSTLTPSLSLNHADAAFESILQQPTDRYYQTDDRDIMNASLTFDRDDWNIQLFITNVSDDLYIEGSGNSVQYGDPRVVGVRARMSF
jgi:iron complex outermembrane receptor protein